MNTELVEKAEKAFDEWHKDLCEKVPLAVYENRDVLLCAFMAGMIYNAKDTVSAFDLIISRLNVKSS